MKLSLERLAFQLRVWLLSQFGVRSRSAGIVCLGDSHTAGVMGTAAEQLRNGVNSGAGAWDPNTVANAGSTGSWTAYLEGALRQNAYRLDGIRVANIGSGGASTYTWSGEMAGFYFYFVGGQPTAGQTVTVGGVVYTFRAAFGVANDVVIGATAQQTALALANVVNGAAGYGSAPNPMVFCSNPAATLTLRVWARRTGVAGSAILCSSTAPNVQCADAGLAPTAHLVGGADTSSVLTANLDALEAGGFGDVDAVTVTLGTNDVARVGYDVAADFASEAARLVANLRTRLPAVRVVWWLPPNTSIPARNALLSAVVRPALVALAAANPGVVTVVDAAAIPVELTGLYLSPDGVHLTNVAYNPHVVQLFARALALALGQ